MHLTTWNDEISVVAIAMQYSTNWVARLPPLKETLSKWRVVYATKKKQQLLVA